MTDGPWANPTKPPKSPPVPLSKTFPVACESEIDPELKPTRPPPP